MHFLITGHTGFKGSWLTLLLKNLGHKVSGISLPPRDTSLYMRANLNKYYVHDLYIDIRDFNSLNSAINTISPDTVIHLAAQPLVLESYKNPFETYQTNFMGTLNLLESAITNKIEKTLIITTDKVYLDQKRKYGYVETDTLGGFDPYSNSKSLADLLTQSYIQLHKDSLIGIARAGNVIGGGDDGHQRLLPDLINATRSDGKLVLRNPSSVRPWQFVLDCLAGYLKAVDNLQNDFIPIWNFGPQEYCTVEEFVGIYSKLSSKSLIAQSMSSESKLKETEVLMLNSEKAHKELDWKPEYTIEKTIQTTIQWYEDSLTIGCEKASNIQIESFLKIANFS